MAGRRMVKLKVCEKEYVYEGFLDEIIQVQKRGRVLLAENKKKAEEKEQ